MTFFYCRLIPSIILPDNIDYIGWQAFEHCECISHFTIPDKVQIISGQTFTSCYSLSSVHFPDSLRIIGHSAFQECYLLENVNLPDSLLAICSNAFWDCWNLSSIRLPENCKVIGYHAFGNCVNLKSVISLNKHPDQHYKSEYSWFLGDGEQVSVPIGGEYGDFPFDCDNNNFDVYTIYNNATLYVPTTAIYTYGLYDRRRWGYFHHIEPLENYDPTGVKSSDAPEERRIVKVFDLQGRQLPAPQKGLNIIHYSDGQVTKERR